MAKTKRRKRLAEYFASRYRLVVMNDDTFEEQTSFKLSRINLYVLISMIMVALVSLIVTTIVVTPIKEYIPGYADIDIRTNLAMMKIQVDSMEQELRQRDQYVEGIRKIVEGRIGEDTTEKIQDAEVVVNPEDISKLSDEDSTLRAEMESEDNLRLLYIGSGDQKGVGLEDRFFFPPLTGFITSAFEPDEDHYGVDVVAPENEPVKSTMDGIVVQSSWTLDNGHVIAVQHSGDLISLYKHNSVLLKKVGNFVRAGDVIAVVGSSGELSNGTHLHFELWHAGIPVDPKSYIVFN